MYMGNDSTRGDEEQFDDDDDDDDKAAVTDAKKTYGRARNVLTRNSRSD